VTKTVELDVAQATLSELIAGLGPNEEVVIVRNDQPVARLVPSLETRQPRKPGNCKGMITLLVEDDEHLKDFEEYMP
jgi:antitoxin (DNA-binding transcriptional repressor) of toxin-antitoxin stability system